VLIADDMEAIRTLYRTGLFHAVPQLRVSVASDGLEAARLAQELTPDVILMT
jgi:CheY-like chemotaxis protein